MASVNQEPRQEAREGQQTPPAAHAETGSSPQATTGKWSVAVVSLLCVAGLVALALIYDNPEGILPQPVEDTNIEPSPAEILVRQLRHVGSKDPARKHALHTSAGHLFRDQGQYGEAARHYGAALSLAKGRPERSAALEMLGLSRLRQGRLSEAKRHLEAAADAAWAPEGAEDNAASVVRMLADLHAEKGQVDEALELYHRALEKAEERQEADEIVRLYADISEAWVRKGGVKEAFDWIRKAREQLEAIRKTGAGLDEALVAKVNSFLGAAYQLRGDFPKAMEVLQGAMAVQVRTLPPRHPDLLATRLALARVQHDLGDSDGSLGTVEAVEKTLRGGPQEGPDLSRALLFKADMLHFKGRSPASQEAFSEAIRLQDAIFQSEDHPDRAVALNGYGSLLHDMGQMQEAGKVYRKALAMNLRTVGESGLETASTYNNLGTLHEDLGEDSKSYEYFSKCLKIQVSSSGASGLDVANTYNNLATVMFRQGSLEDAAGMLQKALGLLDGAGVPSGNPSRTLYEENLRGVLAAFKTSAEGTHNEGVPGPMPIKDVMVA